MEIFRTESETLFETYQETEVQESGNRHNILSTPPIYTITPELLTQILEHTDLSALDRNRLLQHAKKQRDLMEHTLEHAAVFDEFATISKEEFAKHPVQLALADAFFEADIFYTYEEYLAHIQLTKDFAKTHPRYMIQTEASQTFRNIQIHIIEGKCVRLSKTKTPVIHFVIHHPKMVRALENFVAPVTE